ncbi:MAG: hypothetical protein Q8P45_01905 [Candidatus Harrisonbacteria bacterium]|nr:hypothetical protein [Candidatus Harrisonbacteria bacterium]
MDKTLEKLKTLKKLTPSPEYSRRSLALILQTEQQGAPILWPSMRVLAGAFALVMVLSLSALTILKPQDSASFASLDNASLEEEIKETEIVEIKKIRYFNESAERVANALDEAGNLQ